MLLRAEGTWSRRIAPALTLWLLATCTIASKGCSSYSLVEGSPNLPPIPPRLTREEALRLAVSSDTPALLGKIDEREQSIKSLVVEGQWAETPEEREALLKAAGYLPDEED